MTVAKCSLTKCLSARFWIGTQTLPWQRLSQPTPSSSGQGFMHVYLHFWQNDQGLFTHHCANTGVERTPNKSHHTKLALEKKLLPPLLPGFKLPIFWSWGRHSYQQTIYIYSANHYGTSDCLLFCKIFKFFCCATSGNDLTARISYISKILVSPQKKENKSITQNTQDKKNKKTMLLTEQLLHILP